MYMNSESKTFVCDLMIDKIRLIFSPFNFNKTSKKNENVDQIINC